VTTNEPSRLRPIARTPPRTSPDANVAGDFSMRYLLEIIFRRKRLFVVTALVVPLLSFSLSLLIRPSYMSTTTIMLGKDEILNPLVRFEMAVAMTDYNRLGAFQKIIYSRPLIEDAIRKQELDRGITSDAQMEALVNQTRLSTHLMNLTSDAFQIGYTAPDPLLARNMVETISQLFIDQSLKASRREAMAAVIFIRKELSHYEEELNQAETRLQQYRKENNETLHTVDILGGLLNECRAKLLDAELDLKQERLYEKLYEARLAGEKPMVISQALYVQNTPFQRHYQELQLRMGNLLATRDPSHPEVLKLQRELDYINQLLREEKEKKVASETQEVRSPIYLEVLSRLEDARIRARIQEEKIAELGKRQEDLLRRLAREPEIAKEESRLANDVKLTREIYDNLRMKLEHARVSCEVETAQQASRFTIIEPPRVPLSRYQPIRRKFLLAGIVGGLVLGLTLMLLLEFIDPRLLRPSDLAQRTRLPIIGVLPKLYPDSGANAWEHVVLARAEHLFKRLHLPGRRLQAIGARLYSLGQRLAGARRLELPASMPDNLLLPAPRLQQAGLFQNAKDRALDDFIERIRAIGINICAAFPDGAHLIGMIVSTQHGEGKTLLTANVGVVLASDLKKPVLLVDACLNGAALSALFGRAGAPGLGDVLDGRVSLDDVLVDTGTPSLQLLPAGKTQTYADRLFHGPAFAELLRVLRERFSLVLIEAPDLASQSDGCLIAPHMDGIVMISRLYTVKKKAVESMLRKLPEDRIVGLVFNYAEYWIPGWLYRWV
jgi:polysaccharide chain length determinant protein (PEP-CTERM system associated)